MKRRIIPSLKILTVTALLCTVAFSSARAAETGALSQEAIVAAIDQKTKQDLINREAENRAWREGLTDIITAMGQALLMQQSAQDESDQKEMPGMYDYMRYLSNYVSAILNSNVQEFVLNTANLQYAVGNKTIGNEPNPFNGENTEALTKLYNKYIVYFCNPAQANKPNGCGEQAVDGGYFGNNLAQNIVGERTWSSNSMSAGIAFVRAYFGQIPDKLSITEAQSGGQYIAMQKKNARANLRQAALNRLLARRAPAGLEDNKSIVGELFRAYEEAGYVGDSNPQVICRRLPADRTAIENTLCSVMATEAIPKDKLSQDELNAKLQNGSAISADGKTVLTMMSSKAVADRILQFDMYMNPGFINEIYSPTNPARGSLDKLEVIMKAQQLAQDYQYLRDLQMYTALRAVAVSNER